MTFFSISHKRAGSNAPTKNFNTTLPLNKRNLKLSSEEKLFTNHTFLTFGRHFTLISIY